MGLFRLLPLNSMRTCVDNPGCVVNLLSFVIYEVPVRLVSCHDPLSGTKTRHIVIFGMGEKETYT